MGGAFQPNKSNNHSHSPGRPALPSDHLLPTRLLKDRQRDAEADRQVEKYGSLKGKNLDILDESESEDEDAAAEVEKPNSKLFSIAKEILTTERSFVHGLQMVFILMYYCLYWPKISVPLFPLDFNIPRKVRPGYFCCVRLIFSPFQSTEHDTNERRIDNSEPAI